MSDVKRYDCDALGGMLVMRAGAYVLASDFDALAQRCRGLQEQVSKRDESIEEWSGAAVQNGMECDNLRADNERLRVLLKQAAALLPRDYPDEE